MSALGCIPNISQSGGNVRHRQEPSFPKARERGGDSESLPWAESPRSRARVGNVWVSKQHGENRPVLNLPASELARFVGGHMGAVDPHGID
jgi:hypothetical protein